MTAEFRPPAPPAVADLPKPLSNAQADAFVRDGYAILHDALSPEEVDELLADAVAIARGTYPCDQIQPIDAGVSDAAALQEILCIHQPHYVSPVIERYVRHATICGALSQVVGRHLANWDGRVKCMQSMLFVKGPGSTGQAWHQDEIFIPTRDRSLCGAWIALDDATVANGCLWVLPGSHRAGYLYPQRPHNQPTQFDFAPESYGFDGAQEVPVEVSAGSVVLFNGYLLHRSKPNTTDGYRRALVNHYMNAWSLLPWELRDGASPANADVRAIIPVAGEDPYAWKGYEQRTDVWLRPRQATPQP